MPIVCPHCNKEIELTVAIQPKKEEENIFYITRLAMGQDDAKPERERRYIKLEYEALKDRYRVSRRF